MKQKFSFIVISIASLTLTTPISAAGMTPDKDKVFEIFDTFYQMRSKADYTCERPATRLLFTTAKHYDVSVKEFGGWITRNPQLTNNLHTYFRGEYCADKLNLKEFYRTFRFLNANKERLKKSNVDFSLITWTKTNEPSLSGFAETNKRILEYVIDKAKAAGSDDKDDVFIEHSEFYRNFVAATANYYKALAAVDITCRTESPQLRSRFLEKYGAHAEYKRWQRLRPKYAANLNSFLKDTNCAPPIATEKIYKYIKGARMKGIGLYSYRYDEPGLAFNGIPRETWAAWAGYRQKDVEYLAEKADAELAREGIIPALPEKSARIIIKLWYKSRAAAGRNCYNKPGTLDAVLTKLGVSKQSFNEWRKLNKNLYKKYTERYRSRLCD